MHTVFKSWEYYFQSNRNHVDGIRYESKPTLSLAEKRLVAASVSRFQQGEYSEGKNYIRKSSRIKSTGFPEALVVFIREEVDHSHVLGKFMLQENIPFRKNDWVGRLFKAVRKFDSLFQTIHVLLSSEILCMPYYQALKNCTHSQTLQEICSRILRDEVKHIQFQSLALAAIYQKQNRLVQFVMSQYRRVSFMVAAVFFYALFFKVMEAGNCGGRKYVRWIRRNYLISENIMKGKRVPKISMRAHYAI